jgi:hypothetical protein
MRWPGAAINLQKQLGMCLSSLSQNLPEDFDPIRNFALTFAAPTPKEIARMCVGAARHLPQFLGHIMWQQTIDGRTCFALNFLLVQEKGIIVPQFVPGQTRGVASP